MHAEGVERAEDLPAAKALVAWDAADEAWRKGGLRKV